MTRIEARFSTQTVSRNTKNVLTHAWLVDAPDFFPSTQTGFASSKEKAERAMQAHIAGLRRFRGKNNKQDVKLNVTELVETVEV
jgi:hypothetical protein